MRIMSKNMYLYFGSLNCLLLSGCAPIVESANLALPANPCGVLGRSAETAAYQAISLPPLPARRPGRLGGDGTPTDLEIGAAIIGARPEGRATDDMDSYRAAMEGGLDEDLGDLRGIAVTEAGANEAEEAIEALERFRSDILYPALDGTTGRAGDGAAPAKAAVAPIKVRRRDWIALNEKIVRVTQQSGWAAASIRQLGALSRSQGRADDVAKAKERLLIASYMRAYFRHWNLFAITFDDVGLKAAMDAKLATINDTTLQSGLTKLLNDLVKGYRDKLCSKDTAEGAPCRVLDIQSDETFVTRAGAEYAFQKITGTIDLAAAKPIAITNIDWAAIPPDLTRVALEAIGDEAARIPGVGNSTLCKERPSWCTVPEMTPQKMELVNRAGDVSEAGASSLVGAAVRGGWIISLNNETVADTLTAAIAVTIRKTSEAAMWQAINQCGADQRSTVVDNDQNITLKFIN